MASLTGTRLLPIAEAAAVLGISPSATRKRLRAGTITGQRRQTPQGYVWLVEVPDAYPSGQVDGHPPPIPTPTRKDTRTPEDSEAAGTRTGDTGDPGQVAVKQEPDARDTELAVARATISRLEAHLADVQAQGEVLVAELAERRREAQELRALVGIVAQATRALPNGVGADKDTRRQESDDSRSSQDDPEAEVSDASEGAIPNAEASRPKGHWWHRAWAWLATN